MGRTWTVLYDFEAEEEGELSVSAGELVEVVEDTKDGWTLVETMGDQPRTGYVPGEYLGDEDEDMPQYGFGDAEGAEGAVDGNGAGGEDGAWVEPTGLPDGASPPTRATQPGAGSPGAQDSARRPAAGAESAQREAPARAKGSSPPGAFTAAAPRTPASTSSIASSGVHGALSAASAARSSPRSASSVAGALVQARNGSAAGGDPVHQALSKLRISRGSGRAARKPDSLQQAATNEEFDEMIQNHQQWLEALATSRAAAFGELSGGLDRLAGSLERSQEENEKLYTRLDSLCRLIDEERQGWERKANAVEGAPSS